MWVIVDLLGTASPRCPTVYSSSIKELATLVWSNVCRTRVSSWVNTIFFLPSTSAFNWWIEVKRRWSMQIFDIVTAISVLPRKTFLLSTPTPPSLPIECESIFNFINGTPPRRSPVFPSLNGWPGGSYRHWSPHWSFFYFFSEKKRQRGNFCFRRRDYSPALQCYRHAIPYLDIVEHPLLEEEAEKDPQSLLDGYIQVKNNLGQVYLLTNQYDLCLETIGDVLRSQPKNVKALFRQAKALFQLGRYEETLQPLKVLWKIDTDEVEKDKVKDMLQVCQTKLDKYHKNEKEIYRRMFQPTSASPSPAPVTKVPSPPRESSSSRLSFFLSFSAGRSEEQHLVDLRSDGKCLVSCHWTRCNH